MTASKRSAPALITTPILRALHGSFPYRDEARAYQDLSLNEANPQSLRPYQRMALAKWQANKKRGVVVLPTGAGKTYVALKAMLLAQRSTLILAPTIDLVQQWAGDLERRLGVAIGRYGGGDRDLQDITVSARLGYFNHATPRQSLWLTDLRRMPSLARRRHRLLRRRQYRPFSSRTHRNPRAQRRRTRTLGPAFGAGGTPIPDHRTRRSLLGQLRRRAFGGPPRPR